ncbi:MAG: low specificity L-threonine aldolase [Proteobacteria bacterium]|nr:low specificity L-threonine aldolase [Pseudomonadota bacterium]
MADGTKANWNFGSDNVAPIAPEILAAMAAANHGNVGSYGADPWTQRLTQRLRDVFETDLVAFPVATGTAANALALSVLVPPYGSVLCAEDAHINTDECGAPEFYTGGAKLVGLPAPDGRLSAEQVAGPVEHARALGVHYVQPGAISITQSTEWGAVYSVEEIAMLGAAGQAHRLALHMDGARFANALVHLGCSPAEMTWKAGVKVLSFGATKNGAMAAEAVIFFDPHLARGFEQRRKRGAHLWSKMRFMSAQLVAYLDDDLWLRNARRANAVASRLAEGLSAIPGVRMLHPVQANELFVVMPESMVAALLAQGFYFYRWSSRVEGDATVIRLVTSYATDPAAAEALVAAATRLGNQ